MFLSTKSRFRGWRILCPDRAANIMLLPGWGGRGVVSPAGREKEIMIATKETVDRSGVRQAIAAGAGILRLEPCWVPRSFMVPGRRLKLHPDDLYAFGGNRGGINERWFSSTTKASNGPLTRKDEGLSYVRLEDG